MSPPRVVAVAPASAAARAGIEVGDEVLRLNGEMPRDIIQWRVLTDEAELEIDLRRGGLELSVALEKRAGEPLGAEVSSALFDQVRTCDNHCEFCFIYQLPPGLRQSLYLKDDDYRLSFLYGNFTTLTRFTEADLERVIDEGLSPLHVSIHATDPERARADAAQPAGWHQPALAAGAARPRRHRARPGRGLPGRQRRRGAGRHADRRARPVPGAGHAVRRAAGRVAGYNREDAMRPHTAAEAVAVVDTVHDWQEVYASVLGRRLVFAADEYYLLAGRPFPAAEAYEGFPMHEDGVGMARTFELEFTGQAEQPVGRPERVLRLGRRRAGRGLPRPPEPGRGDRAARRRRRLRLVGSSAASGSSAGCALSWRCCRRGGPGRRAHRAATARRSSDRWWRRSGATTCA